MNSSPQLPIQRLFVHWNNRKRCLRAGLPNRSSMLRRAATCHRHIGFLPAMSKGTVVTLRAVRNAAEREVLLAALRRHEWKIAPTAAELHIGRETVYKRIAQFRLRKPVAQPQSGQTLLEARQAAERAAIFTALEQHKWKVGPAARSLECPRSSLYKLIESLGIEKGRQASSVAR